MVFSSKGFAIIQTGDVLFTSNDGLKLNAKLYAPKIQVGLFPAVLIIEGSGKSGFKQEPEGSPFAQLATSLAERGIVVLKYNKRGSGENDHNGSFWKSTFTQDNNDAQAAFDFLRTTPNVDTEKVFLIGHSFGGPQSLTLALRNKVSGIVMLTSTIQPIDKLLLEQNAIIMELQGTPKLDIEKYLSSLAKDLIEIKKGSYACGFPNCSKIDGVEVYENSIQIPWLFEVLNLDFSNLAQNVQSPILFISGTSDCIIPESHFLLAKQVFAAKSSVEFKMIPKHDHFMVENESKKESLEYSMLAQKEKRFKPISKELVRSVIAWVTSH